MFWLMSPPSSIILYSAGLAGARIGVYIFGGLLGVWYSLLFTTMGYCQEDGRHRRRKKLIWNPNNSWERYSTFNFDFSISVQRGIMTKIPRWSRLISKSIVFVLEPLPQDHKVLFWHNIPMVTQSVIYITEKNKTARKWGKTILSMTLHII